MRDANNIVASNEVEVSVLQKAPDIEVSGTPRACAGGLSDAIHQFSLQIHAKRAGYSASNERLQLSFAGNVGNPKKAKFLFYDEHGNQVSSETQTLTTDWGGSASITIISSDTVSAPTLSIKWKGIGPNSLKLNNTAVTSITCDFAKPVGKRAFGVQDRFWFEDFTYAKDAGWYFSPLALQRVGDSTGFIKCQFFLRFAVDPDENHADKNYFLDTRVAAGQPSVEIPSLDADGSHIIENTEWQNIVWRGDENSPLEASIPDATGRRNTFWSRVAGHKLHFKISAASQSDNMMVPALSPALDPRAISFCDQSGNYLQIKANGDAQTNPAGEFVYGPNRPAQIPNFLPITTDANGVATLYVRGGFLSHRINEFTFSVEDTTVK